MSVPSDAEIATIGHPQRWLILAGICAGVFMCTLDLSIVNVALPTLEKQLKADFAAVQWVSVSYALVITSLTLGAARLGDRLGRRRVYIGGMGLFVFASALCGFAQSLPQLVGARVLQGLGGVFVQSLGAALVTGVFPPHERGKSIGVVGTVVALGICFGPSVGGQIIDFVGWRWIFFINVPVGILTMAHLYRVLPCDQGSRESSIDVTGIAMTIACLLLFEAGMTGFQRYGAADLRGWGVILASAVLLIVFLRHQHGHPSPALPLFLFRNRGLSTSLGVGLAAFIASSGQYLLTPFLLEGGFRLPPRQVGLLMTLGPIASGIIAPVAGGLVDRVGTRRIGTVGLFGMAVASAVSAYGAWHASLVIVCTGLVLSGLAGGLFQTPNNVSVLTNVPRANLGIGGGLLTLSRNLGLTIGFPLAGSVFASVAASILGPAAAGTKLESSSLPAAVTCQSVAWFFLGSVGFQLCVWLVAVLLMPKPAPQDAGAEATMEREAMAEEAVLE